MLTRIFHTFRGIEGDLLSRQARDPPLPPFSQREEHRNEFLRHPILLRSVHHSFICSIKPSMKPSSSNSFTQWRSQRVKGLMSAAPNSAVAISKVLTIAWGVGEGFNCSSLTIESNCLSNSR